MAQAAAAVHDEPTTSEHLEMCNSCPANSEYSRLLGQARTVNEVHVMRQVSPGVEECACGRLTLTQRPRPK